MARDKKRRRSLSRSSSSSPERISRRRRNRSRSRDRRRRSIERHRRSRSRDRRRSRERYRRSRSRGRRTYSRSRSRSYSRSRSRDRRSKSHDGKRSRSHDRDDKKSEQTTSTTSALAAAAAAAAAVAGAIAAAENTTLDKNAQQQQLDLEMQKRRERIEKWRQARKKTEEAVAATLILALPGKKWSLEDDEEDDTGPPPPIKDDPDDEPSLPSLKKKADPDEGDADSKAEDVEVKKEAEQPKQEEEEEDDGIDPLDAYMMGIQNEVKQLKDKALKTDGTPAASAPEKANNKVTVIMGVAKKKEDKKKGELMEQNVDALEYSSEEETEDLQTTMNNLQAGKSKKPVSVSIEDISYAPFRKNFYIEVPEQAKMTPGEVETLRAELEGIKVRGKGCPKPIRNWAQCGVSKKVLELLKKHGFEKPTPIQAQAIPAVMSGRDIIGIAKTGSGKTLAFLLPMFRHILDQAPLEDDDGPIAVIMTPTRELAMQITKDCKKFTKSLGLRVVCVYGGTGISEQIADLKRGAEIIVCTPGRMIDMLAANNGRVTNFRRTTYVVLDEADRMFDMGFEPQVMRIIDSIRPDRQTVMFSATFPRQMEALARRILIKPIEILVGGRSVVCKEVEQHVVILNQDDKFFKLLELLGLYQDKGSAIVFVDKQEHADILLKDLMKASHNAMALHGGIDQFDRDSTIVDFKAGKVGVLIATSVAARGLDVKHLILVVNFDCPNHYEDYVHRCGRTGRAGNKGYAYTFITEDQGRYCADVIKALELSGNPIPEDLQKLFDEYKARQEAEGKKVRGGSGFSGKGFKFDEAESHLKTEKKKFQRAALGMQDSDDEDAEGDIDREIESMLAPKKRIKELLPGPSVTGQAVPAQAVPGVPGTVPGVAVPLGAATATAAPSGTVSEKLEMARMLACRINMTRTFSAPSTPAPEVMMTAQSATEAMMRGQYVPELPTPVISAKTLAEQRAEKLHLKLNYQPKVIEEEPPEPPPQKERFQKYEEELEINDFPQQARWKVTSKEAMAQISEYSEAGITVRGTYYPPGKEAKGGDRKLYLAIESTSELAVSKARAEIIRLIKEEMVKMQHSYQPINRGRYKVL
ncbi:probable ATP-dependent RNA helicase DDX46 [Dermacentor albipictus]|uniref:probable ATP-dependent RNA helicase DDX46 n=1 Tax=Dermacentor albipictus TaxID=60249 RepID=UPI0031FD55E7